jgi:hypothetical protein
MVRVQETSDTARAGRREHKRMTGARVALMLVVLAFGTGCRGPGIDPARYLPSDADAIAVLRSTSALRDRAASLFDRLPEAVGAADLLRSATGLDLRSDEGTLEQGLDPRRPSAIAAWHGAIIVALPVADGDVAGRRLGLRLARLGFVEDGPGAGPIRRFHDVRDAKREAVLRVERDVALACAGPSGACKGIEALVPAAVDADAGAAARAAAVEAGMPDADFAMVVRNAGLLAFVKQAFGIAPPGGAAGMMIRATVGDLRMAASLDGGLRVRGLLGQAGDPLAGPGDPTPLRSGVLARADVDLGSLPDGMVGALWDACGARCRPEGPGDPTALLRAWDGRVTAALVASPEPVPGPVTGVRAFLRRAAVAGAMGVRIPDGASIGLSAASSLASTLGVAFLPWVDQAAEGRRADDAGLEGVAGRASDGLEAAAAARGGVVSVAVGRGAEAIARDLATGRRAEIPGAPPVLSSGTLLRLSVDPNGWVDALGGLGVEFVKHLVSSVRIVGAEASLRDGRLAVDATIRLR